MTDITMRAKMGVSSIHIFRDSENLTLVGVSKKGEYPEDGSDENNTYAKFTPSARLEITIANSALIGKFKVGDTFYVDFTPAEA